VAVLWSNPIDGFALSARRVLTSTQRPEHPVRPPFSSFTIPCQLNKMTSTNCCHRELEFCSTPEISNWRRNFNSAGIRRSFNPRVVLITSGRPKERMITSRRPGLVSFLSSDHKVKHVITKVKFRGKRAF